MICHYTYTFKYIHIIIWGIIFLCYGGFRKLDLSYISETNLWVEIDGYYYELNVYYNHDDIDIIYKRRHLKAFMSVYN